MATEKGESGAEAVALEIGAYMGEVPFILFFSCFKMSTFECQRQFLLIYSNNLVYRNH
jgi:hypothetical protein